MAAQLARASISPLVRWSSAPATILAVLCWASPLAGQSVIVSITPGGGSYPIGWQLATHVEFCITDPNEHFYDGGTVLFNDVPVATAQGGSKQGCADFRFADVTVTLGDGTNTLAASVTTFIGQSPEDLYPTTEYAFYVTPAAAPAIDLTPHNGYNRNMALCVAACFNTVAGYTTPAYWTLDAPRAVSLFYSSGQVESRHTVEFAATNQAGVLPNYIKAKLRRPDLSYVTLTTGSTVASFVPPGSGPHRYAFQFEDSTLATGAYDYTLVVTGDWGSGVSETSVPIRVLVINERTSPYGAGWSVAGVQRVILGPGDSLATWDGAGTVQFWARTSCVGTTCTYAAPAGEFDQLQRLGTAPNFSYVRTMVEGTKLTFGVFGQLLTVTDVFNNQTQVKWKPSDPQRIDTIVDPAGKKIAFTYDGSNRLATIRDLPGNRTTSFTVSAQNNLTQIQDAVGGKPFQQATYDSFHRLLARLDRRGGRWASTYDVAGKLATDSTPAVRADNIVQRLVTRYVSPEAAALSAPAPDSGAIGTITPSVGSPRTLRLDAFRGVLEVLNPPSEFARYTRNAHGQVGEAIDSSGVAVFTWSGPRLTQEANQLTGATIGYEWNTVTNRVTRRFGSGTVEMRYFYDAAGVRLDSMRAVNEAATRFTYDARGRVLTTTDPKGHIAQRFYDATQWLNTDSVKAGSRRTRFTYDGYGRVQTVINPAGQKDSTVFDVLNRVTRTVAPLGHVVTYAYGDSLNLTAVTDPTGQIYGSEKSAVGWDTARVDPNGRRDFYAFDRAGRVITWTNRRGQSTQFAYDSTGRLLSRTLSDGRVTTFEYHAAYVVGTNSEGSDTYRIDPDTTWEIAVRGGATYRVRSIYERPVRDLRVAVWRGDDPPFEVTYDLDSLGRVQRIGPLGSASDTLRYSADGELTEVRWHGAWATRTSYRPGHQPARMRVGTEAFPDGYSHDFGAEFRHDSLGRIVEHVTELTGFNGTKWERYTHDSLGRLTGFRRYAQPPACMPTDTLSEYGAPCPIGTLVAQDTFTYDPAGNRTDGGAAVEWGNRLRFMDGDSMHYDLDGNLVRKFKADGSFDQRLHWNSINQLDSVWTYRSGSGAQTVRFGYDAVARRVRKTVGSSTTWYIYAGQQVVAEYGEAGNPLRRYTYLPGVDRPHAMYDGATHYYQTDGRGNVRGAINASGQILDFYYRYTPWGATEYENNWVANNVRFGGRELDAETGLYYHRARYYDPQVGRFVSEDPIGILGGLNVYAFAGNDPINGRDPSGLVSITVWGTVDPFPIFNIAVDVRGFLSFLNRTSRWRTMDADGLGEEWGDDPAASDEPQPDEPPGESCGREAVQFALNAALDIASLWGIGVGIRLAARGVGALARGAAGSLLDPALSFGFQTAGQVGRRRAVAGAGADLIRTGSLQFGVGGGEAYVAYGAREQMLQAAGSHANSALSLLPGYGSVTSGAALIKCMRGS